MKCNFLISLYFILCTIPIYPSGNLHAADTVKIRLTYMHRINENNQTRGYVTINQRFYTPDDVLLREIHYDDTTGQINRYVFYFYNNNRLFSEEYHDAKDALKYVLKYEYDGNGNNIQVSRLEMDAGEMVSEGRTVRRFNAGDLMNREKIYIRNKLAANITYLYNEKGKCTSIKSRYKPVYDTTIIREERKMVYDSENRVSNIYIEGKDHVHNRYEMREAYIYNEDGLLSGIKIYDRKGIFRGEKIYKYLKSGTLSLYQKNDGEGKIQMLLQYDYRKHYMNVGIQESILLIND